MIRALAIVVALAGCVAPGQIRRPACDVSASLTVEPTWREVPAIPAPFTPAPRRRVLAVLPSANLTCTWSLTDRERADREER